MKLFHATTEKKAKQYRVSGEIHNPVRGFNTLMGAMYWAMKVGRKVIYEIDVDSALMLPDHHNKYGSAYWHNKNVPVSKIKCVVSPK